MEPETLRAIVTENRDLEEKLTKRNQQYIFDLKKSLTAANLTEEEKTLALHEILPQLVDGQKTGKTARQLFGTVSECTQNILEKPTPQQEVKPWMEWLDNSLLLLGVLALMGGLMPMLSKGATTTYGLLTLFFASMAGGLAFYLINRYVYQYERPGVAKEDRPSFIKKAGILMGAVVMWIVVFTAAAMLPPVINPMLPPIYTMVIGAAAFGVRYLFKKKFNITSNFLVRS